MTNDAQRGASPPFSYPVKVGHISSNPVRVRLEADERERAGLAALWEVVSVEELTAELQLTRWKKDGVRLKGRVRAAIVQACVVTLEPVESVIEEDVEQIYVPDGSKLARMVSSGESAEMVLDPEGPDLPELFTGDTIDAGDTVAEFVALAIEPYPRKPGITFTDRIEADEAPGSGKPNPFAVLKDWTDKQ